MSRVHTPRRAVPMARVIAGLAMVGLAGAGCADGRAAQAHPGSGGQAVAAVGTTWFPAGHRAAAPPVSGVTLTGARLRLSGYRGKVVVLNFWASWCVPCRAEAPALARLSRAYQARGVQFVGVDVKDPGRAHAEAFERHFGIGYPSLYDPAGRVVQAFASVIPPAIPDTLVIDRTGHIAARVIGQVTYRGLSRLAGRAAGERS